MLLTVSHVTVVLDDQTILSDINFHVEKNTWLVILGPNGAGKSTLLRALLGLVPYKGTIIWQENTIKYVPPQERITRKGLPPLTVADFFFLKNIKNRAMDELLERVGLEQSIEKVQFSELSTGQFQRILIAWALIDKPFVLILDEPTSGLDIQGEELIFSLLGDLKKTTTIIMVTHHAHIAMHYADSVLGLNKKQLFYGRKNEISLEQIKQLYGVSITYDR